MERPSEYRAIVRRHPSLHGPEQGLVEEVILADPGLDSLGTVSLLGALEDESDVICSDELPVSKTFNAPKSIWPVLEEIL